MQTNTHSSKSQNLKNLIYLVNLYDSFRINIVHVNTKTIYVELNVLWRTTRSNSTTTVDFS